MVWLGSNGPRIQNTPNGPYVWTQDSTWAWKLVFKIGRCVIFSWDHYNLARKRYHVNATSFFTLQPGSQCKTSQIQNFTLNQWDRLNFGIPLVLDPIINMPLIVVIISHLALRWFSSSWLWPKSCEGDVRGGVGPQQLCYIILGWRERFTFIHESLESPCSMGRRYLVQYKIMEESNAPACLPKKKRRNKKGK